MPRLSQTVAEKQLDALRNSVDIYMMKRTRDGVDCSTAAAALGFKYSTLRDRRKRPETFTIGEIQRIANTLNVTIPTLLGENN